MSDQNAVKHKNMALKIVIPILLICIVAGIWFAKNHPKGVGSTDSQNPDLALEETEGIDSEGSENPDFALHVTEKIDLEKLKSYGLPIVIDFGADSCIPCKEMAPVLKELNEELKGKAIIKFVDVWKYQPLAEGYPISVIPTQFFFDASGKPYNPKDPQAMKMMLYALRETNEHVFTAHEGGMTKDQILSALKEMGLK